MPAKLEKCAFSVCVASLCSACRFKAPCGGTLHLWVEKKPKIMMKLKLMMYKLFAVELTGARGGASLATR